MKSLNFLKTIWWNSFISQTIENVPWQYWPIWQKFTWNTTLFAFWSPKANSETKRQKIDPKVPNRPPRKGLQTGHWQNPGSYSKKRIFGANMAKIRPFWSVTRKRKVEKSIQRCQIDRLAKGYKRAIDKIRGPIAKNGFSGQNPARWPENGPPSGRTATKNRSEGAKSTVSQRVTNGPSTKFGVL